MKITTVENENRQLELSEYERRILVQVSKYLHDYYGDLEFSIRHFTQNQVQSARLILEKNKDQNHIIISKDETTLLEDIFCYVDTFVNDLIYDSKIEDNEDFESIAGSLSDLLYNNLRTKEEIEELTKKLRS